MGFPLLSHERKNGGIRAELLLRNQTLKDRFFFLYSSIAAPSFYVFFITGVFLTSELGLRVNF